MVMFLCVNVNALYRIKIHSQGVIGKVVAPAIILPALCNGTDGSILKD
jgi:hypothetical protein